MYIYTTVDNPQPSPMETTDSSEVCGIIYKITNKRDGKAFIGKTTSTLERRFYNHKRNLLDLAKKEGKFSKGSIHGPLYKEMLKEGIDNFTAEKICDAFTFEELNSLEGYYVQKLDTMSPNGYNTRIGAKIPQSNNMDKFRKNEESKGLPLHCFYIKTRKIYVVANHPLCNYKQFSISSYGGSHEKTKQSLTSFLKNLEEGEKKHVSPVKLPKPDGLPRGIHKSGRNWGATYCHNGKKMSNNFGTFEKAKEWLSEKRREGHSSTTK